MYRPSLLCSVTAPAVLSSFLYCIWHRWSKRFRVTSCRCSLRFQRSCHARHAYESRAENVGKMHRAEIAQREWNTIWLMPTSIGRAEPDVHIKPSVRNGVSKLLNRLYVTTARSISDKVKSCRYTISTAEKFRASTRLGQEVSEIARGPRGVYTSEHHFEEDSADKDVRDVYWANGTAPSLNYTE